MKEYLENKLHMDVKVTEAPAIFKALPLLFKGQYNAYRIETNGVSWVAIEPKGMIGLAQLRKNRAQVERNSGKNCAIFLQSSNFYAKEKMQEEGIPYVIKDKEVYLPFLGILLSGRNKRVLKPVHRISYLTQKILLDGLYEAYEKATVTYISGRMNVSKMAVSKSFDEFEYMDIDVMDSKGKSRAITMNGDKRTLWDRIKPFMRDPVIRIINLTEDIRLEEKAGITALSEYSMLSDNQYPTYAVLKKDLKEMGVLENREAVKGDDTGCVVLELGYYMDPIKKNVQDPLSVLLCVEAEATDPRVEGAIEEMLEEYVW